LTLAICTAIGIALNWRSLRYGKQLLRRSETLVLVFLGLVWLSVLIGERTVGRYEIPGIDHPSVKLTKVIIFCLMMTHVITTRKRLDALLWVLIVGALTLGLQAYDTPRRAYISGRLNTVGGADFNEANVLAAYLAAMLPLIGVKFLKSKNWLAKGVCLLAGAFATNAIVLTRSRGAVVGLAMGMFAAILLAPRRLRGRVILAVIVAAIGAHSLMDEQFISRSSTILGKDEDRDRSSAGRLEIWEGSVKMLAANPFGVGAGNFHQTIGRYDPRHPGWDAHNTYVRCYGELGIPGIAVLVLLVLSTMFGLRKAMWTSRDLSDPTSMSLIYTGYGLMLSLIILLGCGLTVTLLYVECQWWILVLPVCFFRVVENVKAEAHAKEAAGRTAREQHPSLEDARQEA